MSNLDQQLEIKAQWVADLMKADGVQPEQITEELCLAYMDEVGRRIEKIRNIYLTRNGAKEALEEVILNRI